jgi:hypothetical protein
MTHLTLADLRRHDQMDLEAENRALREALKEAEAVLSIIMPRSNAAEYRRVLGVVRAALAAEPASGEPRYVDFEGKVAVALKSSAT